MKAREIALVIVFVGLVLLAMYLAKLAWTPWRVAGIAIAVPAFVLLNVARVQLGSAFSVRAEPKALITSGIYSRIRNPIYVFASTTLLGLIIWIGRPWLLLILAVVVPLQWVRARKEQALLAAKFGDEYLTYKRQTWF